MRTSTIIIFIFTSIFLAGQKKEFYPVAPIPFTKVLLNDDFWQGRTNTNKDITIPIAFQRSEESGRLDNFRIAAGLKKGTFPLERRGFDDSDVFKIIEGASYSLITNPDPKLDDYLDSLIAVIAKAQEPDGYLYTVRTIMGEGTHRDTQKPRWMGVETGSHELYNVGHLYEAAVAHYEATGKRSLLDVAIKSADLVDRTFGHGKLEMVPGHQEIEIGLVKLYTITGQEKYLNLAKFFLDMRGHTERQQEYDQTHKPVIEQEEAVGHAVRAIYMFAGMADIAALTGNDGYLKAMDKLWNDIMAHKLYITGGIGSPGGAEGFAQKYRLTNFTAYCETCAAVANIFWNQRLFLTHGDSKYIDVLELALYNNVLSGVALDGDRFFYPNKLESRGSTVRSQWFHTSCCPSNISRLIPSVPGYIYAQHDDKIFVNLFISSETNILVGSNNVKLKQESALPWGGEVNLSVEPEKAGPFSIYVRIPSWTKDKPVATDLYSYAEDAKTKLSILVNGNAAEYSLDKGYAVLTKTWEKGDKIQIEFPFEVRKVTANDKVKDNIGRVALQLGPLVYCTEGKEYANGNANNLLLKNAPFQLEYRKDFLNGVMTIKGKAAQLYENKSGKIEEKPVEFTAIPYYGWANRGGAEMLVWLPTEKKYAAPVFQPTIASKSKVETSKKVRTSGLEAVNDLYLPGKVNSTAIPNFNFWPLKDTTVTITYTFDKPYNISASSVFWAQTDAGKESYPKAWKLYYKKENEWVALKNVTYPVNPDGEQSKVKFEKVTTQGLKLEIKMGLAPSGLYEWTVE